MSLNNNDLHVKYFGINELEAWIASFAGGALRVGGNPCGNVPGNSKVVIIG
jgi:hypothetical protein